MKLGQIEIIDDNEKWLKLLENSPQGTRFLTPEFLDVFDASYTLYGYYRKGVCIAGVPVINTENYKSKFLPHCYYQGPFFHNEIYKSAESKKIQYEIELVESILNCLVPHESQFDFCLDPTFQDVRGYSWFNYHETEKPVCEITPRYTAIVDLDGKTARSLRENSRSSRRQEERYAKNREGLEIDQEGSVEELLAAYESTFSKQGRIVPKSDLNEIRRFVNYFLKVSKGHILAIRNSEGQCVAASFIFEDYLRKWHVPIVGTGDSRYGGTLLYFFILDFVRDSGGRHVDFNGANSPNRGYFKHSVGARSQLYFEVSYNDNASTQSSSKRTSRKT